MRAIATGYVKIKIILEDKTSVVPNAMVRLYQSRNHEIVYEDFFMTNMDGETPRIPLYTPLENNQIENATFHLEVRCSGYQRQVLKGIRIYPNIASEIIIVMKDAVSNQPDLEMHILDSLQNNHLYEIGLCNRNHRTLPEVITIHLGKIEDTNAANITLPFKEYIKKCACCLCNPTWPKEVLKANIVMLMTIETYRYFHENYRIRGFSFDICNQDLLYLHQQPMYENITRLVDTFYGYVICYAYDEQNTTKQYWNPVELLSLTDDKMDTKTLLKTYLKTDIDILLGTTQTVMNRDKSSKEGKSQYPKLQTTDIGLHDVQSTIAMKLHKIAKYYKEIPDYQNSKQEVAESILAFQQMLGIPCNGILDKQTMNLIQQVAVELDTKR